MSARRVGVEVIAKDLLDGALGDEGDAVVVLEGPHLLTVPVDGLRVRQLSVVHVYRYTVPLIHLKQSQVKTLHIRTSAQFVKTNHKEKRRLQRY